MASHSMDKANLAERGELEGSESGTDTMVGSRSSTGFSLTQVPSSEGQRQARKEPEEDITNATGQTGCARRRQASNEWRFFPTCEQEFCLVLGHCCHKVRRTRRAIEDLERRNREQGLNDYKEFLPDNEYGKEREKLMDQLAVELDRYASFFIQANTIMYQPAPHVRYVKEFRQWAYFHVTEDPEEDTCAAENYRVLGRPQSVIEGLIHDMYVKAMTVWYGFWYRFLCKLPLCYPSSRTNSSSQASPSSSSTKGKNGKEENEEAEEEEVEFTLINYSIFHFFSHLVVISLALIFLVLPLMLMYRLQLSLLGATILTAVFCFLFCVGSFVFPGGGNVNTDHKFLLLFAYTGVMATLLSNLNEGCRVAVG
ncbi:hypothetical protein QBC43DRAFT_313623 [Cladorrhinum sp. PSN259]|nr:hypothetical protein QBC43DRAFT_313623 [Cladorrhinum sp. PSN259]